MSRAQVSRSKLYARVWETPLSRLAPELGLSDNGLRKLCQRHNIPVPARGYWARLAAGQQVKPSALPHPEDDPALQLPSARDVARQLEARQKASIARSAVDRSKVAAQIVKVEIRSTLSGCHPLVRNTERFFIEVADKIERHKKEESKRRPWSGPQLQIPVCRTINGRYAPDKSGMSAYRRDAQEH